MLPPELIPNSKRTSVRVKVKAPRKSMRFKELLSLCWMGMRTVKKTAMPDKMVKGTWIKKATRQPQTSLIQPPKTPPRPAPTPKQTLPKPCHRPRLRSGTRSDPTNVEIAVRPPPPIPAMTRPNIMDHSSWARPQMRFPAAKKTFEKTSPALLPRMSVKRPLRGWSAALAIRYADASHESREREWKDAEMGAESVAMMVESRAASIHPNQMLLITSKSLPVLGSSTRGVSSSSPEETWFL
ncbi:MAG: hypothetical protein Q9219_000349 [cf. Caloplaca sp. 3 TL-2023]